MSPYEIGILLHYYASPRDPRPVQFDMDAPLWRPTIDYFVCAGLMEKEYDECSVRSWRLTDKGKCYVNDGICNVPLPVSEWRIPERT